MDLRALTSNFHSSTLELDSKNSDSFPLALLLFQQLAFSFPSLCWTYECRQNNYKENGPLFKFSITLSCLHFNWQV